MNDSGSDELRDELKARPPVTADIRFAWMEYMIGIQSIDNSRMEFDGWLDDEVERRVADATAPLEAKIADLERTLVELMPDPVIVEGSWIPVAEWPKILGNFMRSSDEFARKWKAAEARVADAKAEAYRGAMNALEKEGWFSPGIEALAVGVVSEEQETL